MTTPAFTIIGAGPVGALLSLLLARRGHHVRLFERRADPRAAPPERGRSINLALSSRGIAALEHAGVLARIEPFMIPMPGRMLHDEAQRQQFVPYGLNEYEINHAVSRGELSRLIVAAAAEQPSIEMHFNQRCVDFDAETGFVQLRDERTGEVRSEATQCLLAADGARSAVRLALQHRNLTRVEDVPLDHDYKELVIAPDRAGFVFEAQALHIWPRGGFMLIALPNIDHSFIATLFLPRHGPTSFDSLDRSTSVQHFFDREFPDVAAKMPDLTQQFASHPQSQLGTIYCDRWHIGARALLIGDAAHAIVPFHGQGLNCGFEDCLVLDRLLAGVSEVESVFETFERERAPNTAAIAQMALENYLEMRDDVRSPRFAQRKALAAELERCFPDRFIPRYSMVTFHPEISYAEAQRRGALQERLLDTLSEKIGLRFRIGSLSPSALELARQSLNAAGL
jgi:kynurenine 3-monooxygenase